MKGNGSKFAHLTKAHPCFNEKLHDKVGRAHVPIAPKCNIYCNFCTRDLQNEDEVRPGVAACVMSPDVAVEHIHEVTKDGPISVVGIAGPGDSLANEETFEFLEKMAKEDPDLIKCLSTNGLLLPRYADRLAELGVKSITVTINAVDPDIAKEIYSFIKLDGEVIKGRKAAEILIKNQLEGVEKAAENGIVVKINSVLIPDLNDDHIVEIAKEAKKRGASLMNILPLIPLNKMKSYDAPGCEMLETVRAEVEDIMPVFRACTQCRADAYGIPGKKSEDKHLGMTPQSHY